MPFEIKSPYTNTPYDVFSDPQDPAIGVLTPDATRVQIRQQQARVVRLHKGDGRQINLAFDVLLNVPGRLSWDIFLTTTLTRSTDLGDRIEQYKQPAVPVIKEPDWGAELSWFYQSPEEKVEIFESPIEQRSTYDAAPEPTAQFTFDD